MLFSGIDFDQNGTAYIWMGDLWRVTGLKEGMKEVVWKRYATGLDQPFGVRVIDGLPYVLTRGSIVCPRDLNEDEEADYYEEYYSFPTYKHMGHTGTFGFHMDKERAMYFVSSTSAYRKLGIRILNRWLVVYAMRWHWEQVSWCLSCHHRRGFGLLEIQKGDYYGMGPDHLNKDSNDKKITLMYIPIDNSTGGFEFPVSKRFGPLSGEIVGLSYGYGSWYQILRNDDYADYNRCPGNHRSFDEFRAGGMRGAINPKDGMFYAVTTMDPLNAFVTACLKSTRL